ncbi:MAG: hypothetical protein LBP20_09240 [Treponema sp.]|jgi:hypothetical protein|nr:hypothetical protein [Treponema sp.]
MIAVPGKFDGMWPEDHDGYQAVPAVPGEPYLTDFLPGRARNRVSFDPENLRRKINSEEYLHEAIQRIAQVLSGELLKMSRGRIYYERQRKRRK